jgi:virulence-associated protein VapD
MYAITFDFDTRCLEQHFTPVDDTQQLDIDMDIILPAGSSEQAKRYYPKAYTLVRRYLEQNGFEWRQGSVYFFKDRTLQDNLVVLKIIKRLAKKYPWFLDCSRDVRILKIEAENDVLAFLKDDE